MNAPAAAEVLLNRIDQLSYQIIDLTAELDRFVGSQPPGSSMALILSRPHEEENALDYARRILAESRDHAFPVEGIVMAPHPFDPEVVMGRKPRRHPPLEADVLKFGLERAIEWLLHAIGTEASYLRDDAKWDRP